MFIEQELEKRNLPELMKLNSGEKVTKENWEERRKELVECLSENLYGYTPEAPSEVRATCTGIDRWYTFGGKATAESYDISFDTPTGEFTFPIRVVIPKNAEKPPVILHLNFKAEFPVPVEEIIDNGFALVQVRHHLITPDDNHPEDYFASFHSGLGEKYIGNRTREDTEWGKVGMWAYAASRVMDYLQTRTDINRDRIAIAGHSRLGKTALWCRAQDDRFFAAMCNNGNYGGAGLIRGHKGEDIPGFLKRGSYDFFCEGWTKFSETPHSELPFDMHFAVAACAPGLVYVAGATNDAGMDPVSEFLSCCAASEAYEALGYKGFVCDDEYPAVEKPMQDGRIGFHIREGGHAFSRYDWQNFMNFLKKNM
ncbi:MAG: hypothetical protein E7587_00785 [Ruminococcaceae bacterium]|nr:hypothetical protein [Oscillospiraceae bacterium]